MNLIHNERVKLIATLFNTLAAASLAAGAFTPFSAALFAGGNAMLSFRGAVFSTIWLVIAAMLHGAALLVLKGLRE